MKIKHTGAHTGAALRLLAHSGIHAAVHCASLSVFSHQAHLMSYHVETHRSCREGEDRRVETAHGLRMGAQSMHTCSSRPTAWSQLAAAAQGGHRVSAALGDKE
jgi:hypothetical protein